MPRETFTREELEYCLRTHRERYQASPDEFDETDDGPGVVPSQLEYYDELLDERDGISQD